MAGVVKRGEVYWADFPPPVGRRPAVVVTRDPALAFLTRVTVAPLTRTIRDIATEVVIERRPLHRSAISCDNLQTIPKDRLDPHPIARLSPSESHRLDAALSFALGLR